MLEHFLSQWIAIETQWGKEFIAYSETLVHDPLKSEFGRHAPLSKKFTIKLRHLNNLMGKCENATMEFLLHPSNTRKSLPICCLHPYFLSI